MASGPSAASSKHLHTLFQVGMVGGLSDGQLLDRFVEWRDEAAFAALVDRHGPMVLRVCRSRLGDRHEAEDAFQATFMVLAQKASSIRQSEAVAGWLFGVAGRVSAKARSAVRRRSIAERQSGLSRDIATEERPPDPWRSFTTSWNGCPSGIGCHRESVTDADGRYSIAIREGNSFAWGVTPPPGFYAVQSNRPFESFAITPARPVYRKDYAVRRGTIWDFRLTQGPAHPPLKSGAVWQSAQNEVYP